MKTSPTLSCQTNAQIAEGLSQLDGFAHVACGTRGYILLGPGSEEATSDDLSALHAALGWDLFALKGVYGSGHGLCCQGGSDPIAGGCVVIRVGQCGTAIEGIAAFVKHRAIASNLQHKRLRIGIMVTASTGPRCAAAAPSCGPIPYQPRTASYSAAADREPVYGLRGGPCAHDGDCQIGGWGDACRSWIEPPVETIGLTQSELQNAFCGCVAGHCVWFSQ